MKKNASRLTFNVNCSGRSDKFRSNWNCINTTEDKTREREKKFSVVHTFGCATAAETECSMTTREMNSNSSSQSDGRWELQSLLWWLLWAKQFYERNWSELSFGKMRNFMQMKRALREVCGGNLISNLLFYISFYVLIERIPFYLPFNSCCFSRTKINCLIVAMTLFMSISFSSLLPSSDHQRKVIKKFMLLRVFWWGMKRFYLHI